MVARLVVAFFLLALALVTRDEGSKVTRVGPRLVGFHAWECKVPDMAS